MRAEPTTAEKIRKLPWSYFASAANTAFTQFTYFGSVFVLFLNTLGLSKTGIGFLLSLFPFFGLTALFTAPAVERFGHKRTYLTFWTLRTLITAGLLLTPAIAGRFGSAVASTYVGVIVAGFAVCRAVGETGNYPWVQDYVPAALRGKFAATENMVIALASLAAVAVAGWAVGAGSGLTGFTVLITVGVMFGFVSIWGSAHLPGGAPAATRSEGARAWPKLLATLRHRDFRLYLAGAALITAGTGPLGAFLPLFMQEQVGLNASQVVWLQTGSLAGGLLSGLAWGWAADRYGSKPVMLSGIILIALRPLLWMVMPRHSPLSFALAVGIAFASSLISMAWGIGSTRQLFVGLVPPERKTEFMAVHYAWMGAVGGLSQLAGGRLLDRAGGLAGRLGPFTLDPYLVLFVAGIFLPMAAGALLARLRTDSRVTMGEFAGLFTQGNVLLAAESLFRFGRARDEGAAVEVTERLGQARSLLTVEELLEALRDPRFNVRFESILAMARMPADPRLRAALQEILAGPEPALSVIAAWALGRQGDARALPALRAALSSGYRSVQAHAARALGTLQDVGSQPLLAERFAGETEHGLAMAYASALGKLRASDSIDTMLKFLYSRRDPSARLELALDLARLVGDEHGFIQLWRATRNEPGTGYAQALGGPGRRLARLASGGHRTVAADWEACADTFARQELAPGARQLAALLADRPLPVPSDAASAILAECATRLVEFGAARPEYLLLAIHTVRTSTATE